MDSQLAQLRFFYRSKVNCTKQAACFVQFSLFRLFIEVRPVDHPMEFEPAKSSDSTRFFSKIDQ